MEQLVRITDIIGRADTGDSVRRIKQRISHLAGNHVRFIRTGHGNQHIRIIRPGFTQHAWVRAVSLNDTQIELILQAAQAFTVGIHYGNVVVLADQVLCQRSTHLSCAQNDYFHQS